MSDFLVGSICLSDIPKELIRTAQNGKKYLNICVAARKEPRTFNNANGSRTYTHYISCAPKQEERKDGVNYYIADLETKNFGGQKNAPITPEIVAQSPVSNSDDLPF